jgi:hypothetical protein
MSRVDLVPQPLRPMFSPEITVEMKDGSVFRADYPYERMVWDFDKLAMRLQSCLPGIAGGRAAFQTLESAVRAIHNEDLASTIFTTVSALQSSDSTHH